MKSDTQHVHDYVIIGAGPAGCQLSYFLHRDGRDYVTLEAGSIGQFFRYFPRYRRLISNNKVNTGIDDPELNLRWDWNSLLSENYDPLFTTYTSAYFPHADRLVDYLADFSAKHDLNITTDTRVSRVSRDAASGVFTLESDDGRRWLARRVVLASGNNYQHIPDFPGAELAERYSDISTDPSEYTNQRIAVIGKGNSGFEIAEMLFESAAIVHMISPNPVRLSWNTHHVSDIRSVNHHTLDSYQLKMRNTILDGPVVGIERTDSGQLRIAMQYAHAGGDLAHIVVDRVILCTGFRYDLTIFDDSCAPEHDGRFPVMSSSWESVNVPDLFFAGTLMQARDYKRSFSGFIHGFRYNIRFLSKVLGARFHEQALAPRVLPLDAEPLTDEIIERTITTSSIFQLPGFLADVFVLQDGKIHMYADMPYEYALDWLPGATMLTLTLEYGHLPPGMDPFNVDRDPLDGSTSKFIHPVIRLYCGGEVTGIHHVPEDLENEWDQAIYVDPLREAITGMLRSVSPVSTG